MFHLKDKTNKSKPGIFKIKFLGNKTDCRALKVHFIILKLKGLYIYNENIYHPNLWTCLKHKGL